MFSSKQRAKLRSITNRTKSIITIGKNGINEEVLNQVRNALKAREIVKGQILRSASEETRQLAQKIARETFSELVQVIGKKITLYKSNPENKKSPLRKEI